MPLSEAQKRWNAANPDRVRAYKRSWATRNADSERVRARARSKTQPERDRLRAYAEKYRRSLEGCPRKWLAANMCPVRNRARVRGIPFDLTVDDIATPDLCPVLGCKLTYGAPGIGPNSATFDRIIPTLGYVKSNVRIISHLANSCRQDCLNPEVFRALAIDAERLFCGE